MTTSPVARLRRAVATATPRHALWTQVRRSLGRTSAGDALKRRLHTGRLPFARSPSGHGPLPPLRVRPAGSRPVNVLLVSPCDFTGNTALHVHAIASRLEARGWSPAVAVPENAGSARDLGHGSFPIGTYRDLRRGRLRFPDGFSPDLVHAFTPRESVRVLAEELASAYGSRIVVHLEDNEAAILASELDVEPDELAELPAEAIERAVWGRRAHPERARAFLTGAAAVTVVVERLLELVPAGVPATVVWPGFEAKFLAPGRTREQARELFGIGPETLALAFTGNINVVNVADVRRLYEAVLLLRARGHDVVLVRSGWSSVRRGALPELGPALLDVGWVARRRVPELLEAADVLVQPGHPGPFDDYRFPSKLPEFLVSGRPVVMPRTNLGLALEDGREALLLERGDAEEIARAVAALATSPELRERIGAAGRAFALRELTWLRAVDRIDGLYRRVCGQGPARGALEATSSR